MEDISPCILFLYLRILSLLQSQSQSLCPSLLLQTNILDRNIFSHIGARYHQLNPDHFNNNTACSSTYHRAFRHHAKHMSLFKGNQEQKCSELHFSKPAVHACQQNGDHFLSELPCRASRCLHRAKVHLHQRLLVTAAARTLCKRKPP